MIAALKLGISFLPAPVQALILGIIAILGIILLFRIIRMVLGAIPFL